MLTDHDQGMRAKWTRGVAQTEVCVSAWSHGLSPCCRETAAPLKEPVHACAVLSAVLWMHHAGGLMERPTEIKTAGWDSGKDLSLVTDRPRTESGVAPLRLCVCMAGLSLSAWPHVPSELALWSGRTARPLAWSPLPSNSDTANVLRSPFSRVCRRWRHQPPAWGTRRRWRLAGVAGRQREA